MTVHAHSSPPRRLPVLLAAAVAFAILVGLGTWQVQRLHWKEALISDIESRIAAAPKPLAEIERQLSETGNVDYQPVRLSGTFVHEGERHFFTTWQGETGFNVYTPLKLSDDRIIFVNRGFVPYDLKDATKRQQGEVGGTVEITGLARNRLDAKPGMFLPENDPAKNIFYWKDLDAMAATSGLPPDSRLLPFFVDADDAPVPGGWPHGGATIIDLPNSHLQYAITWYGLAAALAAVVAAWLYRRRSEP
ncbi:MAG: SURF1 family protein [Rhizobiaceae bacterium]|nr:SURF1 family protein [Rhizobiaceae bacterium]